MLSIPFSFGFPKKFLIHFILFLEDGHNIDTISCYDNHVARTHQYFIHNTWGLVKESPLPQNFQGLW